MYKLIFVLNLIGCIMCSIPTSVFGGNDVDLYWNKAYLFKKDGKYEQAIENYKKALEIDPNHVRSLMGIATVHLELEQYDYAVEYYKKVVEIEKSSGAYIDLGMTYYAWGKYEEAIDCFNNTLALDQFSEIALLGAGRAYARLGKYEEARECLAKVVQWAKPNELIRKQAQEELDKLNALQPKPTGPTLDYKGYKFSEEQVMEVSLTWLTLIDNGQYTESWQTAAEYFKNTISKEEWEQSLTAARTPLGKVISRNLKTKEYTKILPGVPDGEYVVIQYETSFENKKSAIETVTPMLDKDGKWRVSGYYIK